jgi:RNA polymerase sigma factor (sigma-70 family)
MDNQVGGRYTPNITDETLISQCLAGHQQAWDTLISRYEKLIYYTALRTGIDAVEADDIFQNVCTIWFKQLKKLRDLRSLGAWLVTTTRRECWTRWRRKNVSEEELNDQIASDESAEKLAEHALDAHIVQRAFQQLGEPCHRLLKLLYFDPAPRSYVDVAREMDIPVNSLGPTRARCLEKLKSILKKLGW